MKYDVRCENQASTHHHPHFSQIHTIRFVRRSATPENGVKKPHSHHHFPSMSSKMVSNYYWSAVLSSGHVNTNFLNKITVLKELKFDLVRMGYAVGSNTNWRCSCAPYVTFDKKTKNMFAFLCLVHLTKWTTTYIHIKIYISKKSPNFIYSSTDRTTTNQETIGVAQHLSLSH